VPIPLASISFDWMVDPQAWIALATLTLLELVLGIDNIVFISILSGKLPAEQRQRAWRTGLSLALVMRVLLLLTLSWLVHLTDPLFVLLDNAISGRDLILLVGGLFLIAKSTHEIHDKLEGAEDESMKPVAASFRSVIIQIMMLDMIFSLDSVITAVGMVSQIEIMISAVVISIGLMMIFAASIGTFVERHPTVKMLALSFLLLIGVALIADGLDQHIPRGYIYFAMGFSVVVEMLNLRIRDRGEPVRLHHTAAALAGASSASRSTPAKKGRRR
jgi:predicted tellurium resistance membrane protein TerC